MTTYKKINILGLTQGSNIEIFINLINTLKENKEIYFSKVSAYVSFARLFDSSKIVKENHQILYLKEWEIFSKATNLKINFNQINELNNFLDKGRLWKSVIGDRRLIYGKHCKSIEDYETRFNDKFLYSLIYQFINDFKNLIETFKPDIAIGFTAVTFGELLAIDILKKYNIPVLQLHSSRISNYFALHDELIGTSKHIKNFIDSPNSISKKSFALAEKYITEYSDKGILYEGVNLKKTAVDSKLHLIPAIRALPSAIFNEIKKNLNKKYRNDHHDNGNLVPWFYENILQKFRKKSCINFLKNKQRIININSLNQETFAFFPLHSEPEVSLQVLAPPYHKNQIELVRNIASSIPFGMKLIIKEHPRSFGLRKVEFYKKILEIPNVYFSEMEVKSIEISKKAKIVFVISSTIGLESAIIGKPLVILGNPKYLSLPKTMFTHSLNMFNLHKDVNNIINNYKYDKDSLIIFIASIIEGSIDIDLYSVLLEKKDRFSEGREGKSINIKRKEDYDKLAKYTVKRIKEELLNKLN